MDVYGLLCFLVFSVVHVQKINPATTNRYQPSENHWEHRHFHSNSHDEPFSKANEEVRIKPPTNTEGENEPNYPYEEIRNFLENNKLLKDYFIRLQVPEIGNRNNIPTFEEEEGESLCKIRQYKILYPQKLQNLKNVWKTIVNIKNEYEQAVEVKSCFSEGQCTKLEGLPFGFTSFCSQEYITKQLMVYNSSTTFDLFKFPSCCVCKIKRV